jgi:tRNA nucleotidyltransferase (CCA-adding enzyme)
VLLLQIRQMEGLPPSQLADLLEPYSQPAQAAVRAGLADSEWITVINQYQTVWRHVHPGVDGNDLRARGLPAGPAYKHILVELKHAWLDGMIHNNVEETTLLEKLISEASSENTYENL